ncbi:hypothetical protein AaE_000149, partial [Aphanomyces astaci]
MPLDEGYLHESAMVEHAFSDVMTWQPRIRTIFHKHHNLTTAIQSHLTHHPWTTPIHPLTSRVNPTFSIHDHLVIKWFSPLNRLWGECHEAHVLTVDFPKSGREVANALATSFVLQPDVSKEDDNDDDDNDRIEYDGGVTWTPRMVIDFADTKTGDPLWDVIPVLFSML